MLQNAYFIAKIGADRAENEQHFAEILPIGRRVADRCPQESVRTSAERIQQPAAFVPAVRGGEAEDDFPEDFVNIRVEKCRNALRKRSLLREIE